jgi:hypothetical protein
MQLVAPGPVWGAQAAELLCLAGLAAAVQQQQQRQQQQPQQVDGDALHQCWARPP